jgi:starch-binding outer membrane protein, SusD/RagB family
MSNNINKYLKRIFSTTMSVALLLQAASCKKFIEVDVPVTSVNAGNVYQNNSTATSVLTDIYSNLSQREPTSAVPDEALAGVSLATELSADNLTLFNKDNTRMLAFFENKLLAAGTPSGVYFWDRCYEFIYRVNAAMEGITNSTALTPAVQQQLLGECRFFRAFFYFYLVNLYGDVPLVLTTDYKQNALLPRTASATVYNQVLTDLLEAKQLLNEQYVAIDMVTPGTERLRVNRSAARAMLARVYLYLGDYAKAEAEATAIINNGLYSLLTANIGNTFLKNSLETIWSLQPVQTATQNTWAGKVFLMTAAGPNASRPVYLSDELIATYAPADKRLTSWIANVKVGTKTYYYPAKYKAGSAVTTLVEYDIVLRLAEQYLIRAEARAQQNNLTGTGSAVSDLNVIRTRAGLSDTTISNQQGMLDAILLERRKELFTEWGHRWFDLKRTGKIDGVMQAYAPVKGTTWESYKSLYPIAQKQIDLNPGMTDQQNQGY